MATVYLAEDTKHRRKVALKVLRPELAATMGAERFLHEIEIAARLQHPNILPLLDSGDSDGFLYYVMPFIEGQTLRDRLLREGELPIAAAVKILTEVVDALAEAHRHGVIHRDIKPENVLLTGRHALVADFGVAKALNEATGRHQLTTAGVALGTPAYMAPEQASAEPNLDHRVDLYAVGAMAYEMLTGRPPFTGSSAQQILAAHMTQAPEAVSRHRASTPPALEAAVMKCLAKRPADRWQSAEELLAQLEPILTTPSGGVTPTDTRPALGVKIVGSRRMLVLGIVGGIVLLAVGAALWRGRSEERIEFGPVRPLTSDPGMELDPAVSADGKLVAYVAGPIGELRIYVRSVSGGTPIQLIKDVTGPQVSPQWSPDGTRILFMLDGAIHVVPSLGGIPRVVVERGQYATGSPDGKAIAYVNRDTLLVRGVDGGPARPLLTGLPELHSLAWSPDGKLIALIDGNADWRTGNVSPSALMVIPASGGEPVRLTDRRLLHQSPAWMPDSRHLLFVSSQDGGRDIYALTLSGSGRPRGPSRRLTTGLDIGTFSVSADGKVLAYSSFPNKANIWSVPIPSGRVTTEADATPVTTGTQRVEGVAVSRDGEWIAFDSDRQGGNPAIHRMRLGGGEPQQITSGRSLDFMPSFSPDGKEIVFHSWRSESRDVYVVPVGGGEEKLIAGGPDQEQYPDWSPDGRTVVFHRANPIDTSRRGMFVVSRDSEGRWGEPRRLARGGFAPRWSPDGRWILYRASGTGSPSSLWVISPQGGEPRQLIHSGFGIWSPDSRSVYYRGEWNGRPSFWSVPVEGGTPTLRVRFESPTFTMGHFMFATDGMRLYFTVRDYQSDIKVMEVLRRK